MNKFKDWVRRIYPTTGAGVGKSQGPRPGWNVVLAMLMLSGCNGSTAPPAKNSSLQNRGTPASGARLLFADRTANSQIDFTYRSGSEPSYAPILQDLGGGCGLFDMDRDGHLDAFFPGGGYISPDGPQPHSHGFFRNLGQATFRDVSESSGLIQGRHYSHGVSVGDFDADGFSDLIVTGYGGLQLFRNQGDGTFIEVANEVGLTDRLWSTSAAWGDVNGDGILDLYVCHYVDWSPQNDPVCAGPTPDKPEACPPAQFKGLPDALYLSSGSGTFDDVSHAAGLRADGKGLGVLIADLDSDGDADIYVANDTVANFLYRNEGNEGSEAGGIPSFTEIGLQSGSALSDSGTADGSMGIALLDFNQDRRPDLWVSNFEFETPGLYRNEGGLDFTHVTRRAGLATQASTFVSFGTVAADFDGDGDDDVLVTNGHISRNGNVLQPCQLFENLGKTQFQDVAKQASDCLNRKVRGRGLATGDLDGDGDLDAVLSPIDQTVQILENRQSATSKWLNVYLSGTSSPRDGRGTIITLSVNGTLFRKWVYSGESYLSASSTSANYPDVLAGKVELEVIWASGQKQILVRTAPDKKWATNAGSCSVHTTGLLVIEPN